jgi:hypothetical protein
MSIEWKKAIRDEWKPKKVGDFISGKVISIGEILIDDRPVGYVDLQTPKGEEFKVFMGSAGLAQVHKDCDPKVGDFLALRYAGESENVAKKGNRMKLWEYAHEPSVSTGE